MKISIGYSNLYPGFYKYVWNPYKENISSIFFSLPKQYNLANARGVYTTDGAFEEIQKMKKEKPDLDLNLLLNSSCIGHRFCKEEKFKIRCALQRLYGQNIITSVTVSNSWYLGIVYEWKQEQGVPLDIHLSVIWDIKTIDEYENIINKFDENAVQCINISRTQVHNMDILREFKKRYPHITLKVIVNEWCMHNCPDQSFHENFLSHSEDYSDKDKIYNKEHFYDKAFFCNYNQDRIWYFLRGKGIPPEFIDKYDGLVDIWKIGSRKKHPIVIAKLLAAYISRTPRDIKFLMQTSHGGIGKLDEKTNDLLKSLKDKYLPLEWFERRLTCENKCYKCNYCENLFKKAIKEN